MHFKGWPYINHKISMNPANKFMIFLACWTCFMITHWILDQLLTPNFFFLYMGYFDSVILILQGLILIFCPFFTLQSLSGHTTPIECVRFGHTEELVCAGSTSGALKIWDLEAARLVRTLTGHKSGIRCIGKSIF